MKATSKPGIRMMISPRLEAERDCAAHQADPRNYIAQPTLALSRVPLVEDHLEDVTLTCGTSWP